MSPVQVAALDLLLAIDSVHERRRRQEETRLAVMDKDPDMLRVWFPTWFPAEDRVVRTDEDADAIMAHEMSGAPIEWVAGETPEVSAEDVEALIASLTQGSANLGDISTSWE